MFEILENILIEKLGIDSDLIKPGAYLEKDLELDSTETVVIALELKKRLGVNYNFPEEDIKISEICEQVEILKNK